MEKVLLEKQMDDIVRKTVLYMITHQIGTGFVTKEDKMTNSITVDQVPGFIADLQSEGILPEEVANCYVQYTVDGGDSTFEEMGTKFIVFNEKSHPKAVIPFYEVIRVRNFGWYEGLLEAGFRKIVAAMLV
jgi:hypothetical protein